MTFWWSVFITAGLNFNNNVKIDPADVTCSLCFVMRSYASSFSAKAMTRVPRKLVSRSYDSFGCFLTKSASGAFRIFTSMKRLCFFSSPMTWLLSFSSWCTVRRRGGTIHGHNAILSWPLWSVSFSSLAASRAALPHSRNAREKSPSDWRPSLVFKSAFASSSSTTWTNSSSRVRSPDKIPSRSIFNCSSALGIPLLRRSPWDCAAVLRVMIKPSVDRFSKLAFELMYDAKVGEPGNAAAARLS